MIDLTKIKFLQSKDEIKEFVKGWSGDKTYIISRDKQKFFLKVLVKNSSCSNFENFNIYKGLCIPYPTVFEYGNIDSQTKYYISEFIESSDFGDILKKCSDEFIFSTAQKLGKEQLTISNHLGNKISNTKDADKLFEHYDKSTDELLDLLNKYKDKLNIKYTNPQMYTELLYDISNLKKSFENEKLFYCHDDFMPNNFILDKNNKIWTIDIEGSKYDFFAKKLRGYIQHMLHKNEKEKIIVFFRGFISGFFGNDVPKNLAKQMSYIYLVDMLEICRDPLKKANIKEFYKRCDLLISSWGKGSILKQCEDLF